MSAANVLHHHHALYNFISPVTTTCSSWIKHSSVVPSSSEIFKRSKMSSPDHWFAFPLLRGVESLLLMSLDADDERIVRNVNDLNNLLLMTTATPDRRARLICVYIPDDIHCLIVIRIARVSIGKREIIRSKRSTRSKSVHSHVCICLLFSLCQLDQYLFDSTNFKDVESIISLLLANSMLMNIDVLTKDEKRKTIIRWTHIRRLSERVDLVRKENDQFRVDSGDQRKKKKQ